MMTQGPSTNLNHSPGGVGLDLVGEEHGDVELVRELHQPSHQLAQLCERGSAIPWAKR